MEILNLEATDKTPSVELNPTSGVFTLQGKSITGEAEKFYRPILDWLDKYNHQPHSETTVNIKLDYFNISSSKRILFILYKLNELVELGKSVSVNWYFHEDEDDMFEIGQDFAFMVKVPFKFIEYNHFEKEPALI